MGDLGVKARRRPGLSDDETYSITIDQQTCLPARVQMLSVGVLQLDYSLHNVRVDEPLPDTAFTFAPPKGAKVVRSDAGFRRLPLARIGSTAGHVTLLPTWLPAGYVQSWTAAAARSTTANGVTEGRDVVALQYVRGFDALTVTTRTVADPQAAATIDPWSPTRPGPTSSAATSGSPPAPSPASPHGSSWRRTPPSLTSTRSRTASC